MGSGMGGGGEEMGGGGMAASEMGGGGEEAAMAGMMQDPNFRDQLARMMQVQQTPGPGQGRGQMNDQVAQRMQEMQMRNSGRQMPMPGEQQPPWARGGTAGPPSPAMGEGQRPRRFVTT